MIRIICLGKIKEEYLNEMIEDYKKRISKYHKIEIIELKDCNDLQIEEINILKNINSKDFTIACDIFGESLDSIKFAKKIDEIFQKSGTINFIIGSSIGLTENVKNHSNMKISFSNMTMPHGLFRAILLEQIYRAFKINNNETYHK